MILLGKICTGFYEILYIYYYDSGYDLLFALHWKVFF